MLLNSINYFVYFLPLGISIVGAVTVGHFINFSPFYRLMIEGSIFFGVYYLGILMMKEPIVTIQIRKVIDKLKKRK